MTATGRCLCGEVRYAIDAELGALVNCHCQFCRRAHGSAFSTISQVPSSAFRFTQGEEHVKTFARAGGERLFCGLCGTRLLNRSSSIAESLVVVVASLDEEPPSGPVLHLNVESKAGWYDILDDKPQFDAFPPEIQAQFDKSD